LFQGGIGEEKAMDEKALGFLWLFIQHKKLQNEVGLNGNIYEIPEMKRFLQAMERLNKKANSNWLDHTERLPK